MKPVRSRSRRRGAALVEAAVVIPTMLIFLGCILFVHRGYDVKLDKQTGTRAGVLYYASHACEGDVPRGIVPDLSQSSADPADGNAPADPASKNAGKLGGTNSPGAQAGVKRSNNLVKALPPDTLVEGSAVMVNPDGEVHGQNIKRSPLHHNVSAASEVACNEKAYPNKWTAVFQEIGQMWRSKGGLAD